MTLTISATVPVNPSAQLQVVLKMTEAGIAFDFPAFRSTVTEDYIHEYLPSYEDMPRLDREGFITRLEFRKNIMTLDVDLKDIIEAPGVTILHMSVSGKTKGGNVSELEVLNLVYTAEQPDGTTKAIKSREFIDTARMAKFAEALKLEMTA